MLRTAPRSARHRRTVPDRSRDPRAFRARNVLGSDPSDSASSGSDPVSKRAEGARNVEAAIESARCLNRARWPPSPASRGSPAGPTGDLFGCDDAGQVSRSIPTGPARRWWPRSTGGGSGSPVTAPGTSTSARPGPRPWSASTWRAAHPRRGASPSPARASGCPTTPCSRPTGRCTCRTPGRRRRARWTGARGRAAAAAARRPSWPTGSTTPTASRWRRTGTLYVVESYDTPGRHRALARGRLAAPDRRPAGHRSGRDRAVRRRRAAGVLLPAEQDLPHTCPAASPSWCSTTGAGLQTLTPTNIAFFGPGGSRLAIASLAGWQVSWADTPWRGQPLNYPG